MARDDVIHAIVIGCTRLPLLFGGSESLTETIDVLEIHVKELIRMILEGVEEKELRTE